MYESTTCILHKKNKAGHLDAPSHPPMLGHVGAMLDHFGILLGDLMAMLKHFGTMSGHLGAMLGHLGPPLGYLGAMLDHLGALLDYLEAILSLIMTWLGHPGVILVQTGLERMSNGSSRQSTFSNLESQCDQKQIHSGTRSTATQVQRAIYILAH